MRSKGIEGAQRAVHKSGILFLRRSERCAGSGAAGRVGSLARIVPRPLASLLGIVACLALLAACAGDGDGGDPTEPEAMVAAAQRAVERAHTAVDGAGSDAWIGLLLAFEQGYSSSQLIAAIEEGRVPEADGRLPADRVGVERPVGPALDHLEARPPGDATGWAVLASHHSPAPLAHGEPIPVADLRDDITVWARAGDQAAGLTVAARLLALADLGYSPRQIVESLTGGGTTGSFYCSADEAPVPADVIAALTTGSDPGAPPFAVGRHCEVLRDRAGRLAVAEQPGSPHARRCADHVEAHRAQPAAGDGAAQVYVGETSSVVLVDGSGTRGCQDFGTPVTAVLWPGGEATLDIEFRLTLDPATGECRSLDEPGHLQFLGFRDDTGHITLTAGEVAADATVVGEEVIGAAIGSPGIEGWVVELDFVAPRCPGLDARAGEPPAAAADVPAYPASGC